MVVKSLPPFSSTSRKGQGNGIFALMVSAVFAVVLIFVALSLGADIMSGVQDTQTGNTTEYNISQHSLTTMGNISEQGGNIGLIVGVGMLLLVLTVMFGKLAKNGMGGSM